MILSDKDMTIQPDDEIVKACHCALTVQRTITLHVCRCRECNDTCDHLAAMPYLLCVNCNNNHSQDVDGTYVGPFRGKVRGGGE